jgi:predicted ATPase
VFCIARTAWLLAVLGFHDQPLRKSAEAFALARRQSHVFSLAVAQVHIAHQLEIRKEWAAMQERAEETIIICREQGFGSILAQATMYRGCAISHQGQAEEGIALMRSGLDAQLATGALLFRPHFLFYLAEAYGIAERFEEGLDAVAQAFATEDKTNERHSEANLHRVKGDLILRRARAEADPVAQMEAEECFRKSIEVSRNQEAKSFEL